VKFPVNRHNAWKRIMIDNIHAFHLIGGRLCLDFLNTADWAPSGDAIVENLTREEDMMTWCRRVGLHDLRESVKLSGMEDLRDFRSALRRVFLKTMEKVEPDRRDLAMLNGHLGFASHSAPLVFSDRGLRFSRAVSVQQAIALSAAAVLTDGHEIGRLKSCPADDCGWLFLDESRNRRRKWCSMEICGNRAKARRHYHRHAGPPAEA
jgi:predicted RNA-binding Zn ribbon-like protein